MAWVPGTLASHGGIGKDLHCPRPKISLIGQSATEKLHRILQPVDPERGYTGVQRRAKTGRMETTVGTGDAKRTITIRQVKSSARAATDLLGNLEILKGDDVILSVWGWEIQALVATDDGTMIVMKGKETWHEVVDVPLAEVRGALVTCQALWQSHKTAENLAFLKARS